MLRISAAFTCVFALLPAFAGKAWSASAPQDADFGPPGETSLEASWSLESPGQIPLYALSTVSNFSTTVSSETGFVGQQEVAFSNLDKNTTYYFKVKVSTHNDSLYSATIATATLASPPAAGATVVLSSGDITVNWSHNGNRSDTRYGGELASNPSFIGKVTLPFENILSYTANELNSNTTYYFRVRALSHGGQASDYTILPAAITNSSPPVSLPPTNRTDVGFTANWITDQQPRTQYNVELSTASNYTGSLDQTTGWVNELASYGFIGLTQGAQYYTRVRSRGLDGVTSSYTNLPTTTTLNYPYTPGPTGVVFSSATETSIGVAWTMQNPNEAPTYALAEDAEFTTVVASFTGYVNQSSHSFTGLSVNTTYHFRIKVSTAHEELYSVPIDTGTRTFPPTGNPSVALSSSDIQLSWNANGNPGTALYKVVVFEDPEYTSFLDASDNTLATTLLAPGLTPATSYYFIAYSLNWNDVASATTTLETKATLAEAPTAQDPDERLQTSLRAKWFPAGNASGTPFRAQISTAPDFSGSADQDSGFTADMEQHTFTGLLQDTTYYTRVNARNPIGVESPFTNLPATMTYGIPAALPPSGVQFTFVSSDTLTANWNLRNPGEAALYALATSTDFAAPVSSQTVAVGTQSVVLGGLGGNTSYFFKIKVSTVSDEFYSQIEPALTLAAPPVSDASVAVSSVEIRLQWQDGINHPDTEYSGEISLLQGFGAILQASEFVDATSIDVGDLTPNTTYYSRVRAQNRDFIESSTVALPAIVTLAEPPFDEFAKTVLDTSFELGWSTGINPMGTEFYAALSTASDFSGSADLNSSWVPNRSSFTFTGLAQDTTYYARVRSRNRLGVETAFTTAVSSLTFPFEAILPPTGITFLDISTGSARADWSLRSPGEVPLYAFSTVADFSTTVSSETGTAGQETKSVTGLTPNTTLYFKVKVSTAVDFLYSQVHTTATLARIPVSSPTVVLSSADISAYWGSNDNPVGTEYSGQISGDAGFASILAQSPWAPVTTVEVNGLSLNTTYYLRVQARNWYGTQTSTVALPVAVTHTDRPDGSTPIDVYGRRMTLRWSRGPNPVGTSFSAEVAEDPSFTTGLQSSPFRIDATSHTFGGLSLDTTYYARVRAANHAGAPGPYRTLTSTKTLPFDEILPPTEITLATVTQTTIGYSWSMVSPLGSPLIAFATDADFSSVISSVTGGVNQSSHVLTSLSVNTSYFFRVKVSTASDYWWSPVFSTATLAYPPTAQPLTVVSSGGITAAWNLNGNPGGTQFFVEYAIDPGFASIGKISTWQGIESFTPSGLVANTTYYVRVRGRNLSGAETPNTDLSSACTYADSPKKSSPPGPSDTAMVLNWNVGSNPGWTPFLAEADDDPAFGSPIQSGWLTANTTTLLSLSPNTTYYLRVKARNCDLIETATVRLTTTATRAAIPGASIASGLSTGTIVANWTANGNPPGTQYSIQTAEDALFTINPSSRPFANVFLSTFTDLAANTTFYFRVKARNHALLETAYQNLPDQATDADVPVSASPTTITKDQITANWTAGTNPAGTSYRVQRATDSGFGGDVEDSGWKTDVDHTFTSLTGNTSYYFRVRARGHNGAETAWVALPTALTLSASPTSAEPQRVFGTTLRTHWGFGVNAADTEFFAELATDLGFTANVQDSGWRTGITSHTFTALTLATTYYTRVKSRNSANAETLFVNLPSTATLPFYETLPPVGIFVDTVTATSLDAAWALDNPTQAPFYMLSLDDAFSSVVSSETGSVGMSSITFSGLAVNTTHYFKIRVSTAADLFFSDVFSTSTLANAPGALSPVALSSADAAAFWSFGGNPAGTQFLAERANDSGFSSNLADGGWTGANGSTFTALTPNTTFYLRVRARNHGGTETGPTSLGTVMTLAEPPSAIANVVLSSAEIFVAWSTGTNPAGTELSIEISSDAGFSFLSDTAGWADLRESTFAALTPNTLYYARGKARNAIGTETDYVSLGSTRTYAEPPGAADPSPVLGRKITPRWTAGANPSGTEYYSQISSASDFTGGSDQVSGWITSLFHEFDALSLDTTYYTRVKARNGTLSETPYTALVTTMTLSFEETLPPENIRFSTGSPVSLDAAWDLLSPTEAPLYVLATDSVFTAIVSSQSGIPGQESVNLSGLTLNTTYYFKIKVSTAPDIFYSVTYATATEARPPGSASSVVLSSADARLDWTDGGNPAGTEFIAEAATNAGFTAGLASGAWTTGFSSTITALAPNTTYYLRARARNWYGHPTSNADATPALTLAEPPATGAPTSLTSATVAANWGPASNPAGTEFLVQRATDAAFTGTLVDGGWTTAHASTLTALAPNTTYYLRVRARNHAAVETSDTALPDILTLSEPPGAAPLTGVFDKLLTANWTKGANPPQTEYYAELSTAADFTGTSDQNSGWLLDRSSSVFGGLSLGTTYYLRAKSRNSGAVESAYTALGSTATLPFVATLPPADIFFATVTPTALDAVWTLDNPGQTPLYALSVSENFGTTVSSTLGSAAQSSVSFPGLDLNTTYYFKIKVSTAIDLFYSDAISTPTHAGVPLSSPSAAVSPVSVAAHWLDGGNPDGTQFFAEAATNAAFSAGLSSDTWTTNSVSTFGALSVNTTYYLRVRARNWARVETSTVALPAIATDASPPASPSTTVLSTASIRLDWNENGNPAGTEFRVQMDGSSDFSGVPLDSGWITQTDSTLTVLLSPNTTQYLRVRARSHNGNETAYAAVSTAATHAREPGAGTPAAVSSTSLAAFWTLNTNPAGTQFYAQIASDAGFTANTAASGWTTGTDSTFTALSPNTTYYLRVKARNHGAIETANIDLSSTATHAAPPAAGSAVVVSTGDVAASWSANGNSAGTEFLVEASTESAFGLIASSGAWTTLNASTFTSLPPNTTHFVRVRARNYAGVETSTVSLGSVATLARAPASASPVVLSSADLAAAWDRDGNPAGTEFFAQAALDSGFTAGLVSGGWTTTLSSTFSTLSPNTSYYLRVKARNHGGVETAYTALPATMTYSEPPGSLDPTRVFATRLTANWNPLSNPSGTLFSAEVSTAADFSGTLSVSPWTSNSSHTFTGLTASKAYYGRVRSRDGGGHPSLYTNLPTTTTLASETLPPDNVAFDTATATELDASWILENNTQTPFYALSTASNFATTVSSTLGSLAQSSASIGGLTPNTTYWFTVKVSTALDAFYSVPIATATRAAVPGSGSSTALSSSSLRLAWTANSNPGDTLFLPEAALDAGYTSGVVSGTWTTSLDQDFSGLSADATYYIRVRAKNRYAIESATGSLGELATLAAPPGTAAASAQTTTTLRVNWGAGANTAPTTFTSEISTEAVFGTIFASSTTLNAFADYAGLSPNTRYYSRVRAVNHAGTASSYTSLSDAVTLATTPANPGFVRVLSQSVEISWDANGNPDGTLYRAERATDVGFTSNTANSGWVSQTTVTLTGLTAQTTYYIRVLARNFDLAQTDYLVFPSTPTDATPPNPVGVSLSSVFVSSLTANWQLLVPNAIPFYALSTRVDFATTVSSQAGSSDQETVTFTGLDANTTYYFKVKFHDASDSGYTTPTASATYAAAPGTPTQGDASSSTLTAVWSASTNGPGTIYTFEFDDDPAFGSIDASSVTRNSSATISGLIPNSRYYGRVRAFGHNGDTTADSSAGALATRSIAPGSAASPFVAVTFTSVTARWTPLPLTPSTASAQGYVLEASTSSDFTGTISSTSLIGSTDTLAVGGLSNGTTYYIRVGSLNLDLAPNYLVLGSTLTFVAGTASETITAGQIFSVTVTPADPEITSLTVEVPANALPAGTTVTINTGVAFQLPPPESNQLTLTPLGGGVGVEIDAGGAQPSQPVSIRLVYDPAMLPSDKDPNSLVMARYDPNAAQWTLLPTTVDTGARTVTGLTDHFSLFAAFFAAAATSLDNVQVFPVPWTPGSGSEFDAQTLKVSNIPAEAEVSIYSIHGEQLRKLVAPASGVVDWDGKNGNGHPTASGTYLILIKSGGSHATRRAVVIR
jgi:hypothetical protein